MKNRGEDSFVSLPGFAARLYDNLVRTKAIECQHRDIAQDLVSNIEAGRLLDIGFGPGRLLLEIHRLNSRIELYGLDISEAMIELAKENLAGLVVDLRRGSIRHTDYDDDFFDIVTCTGSFYLWNDPIASLEEIYRILKSGRSAYLFETYKDFSKAEVQRALKANLREENLARRLITPVFLRRQLKMAYQTSEIAGIIKRTDFASSYSLEKIMLGGLPAWVRVRLTKTAT